MLPAAFVQLDQIPLTPSGKVDRKLLPAPGLDSFRDKIESVAPRNELERQITNIWQEVLGIDDVGGVNQSFFEIGGNSILIIKIVEQLKELLQQDIALVDLFRYPTIGELACHFAREDKGPESSDLASNRSIKRKREGKSRMDRLAQRRSLIKATISQRSKDE
jgi:acyl carrier protein